MPDQIPPEVRAARRDVARLSTERAALLRESARLGAVDHARLRDIDGAIAGILDGVDHLVDPCDASEVDPLVLLPVRLETRYASEGNSDVLHVRIYPDEIHVDDLVRGLTDDEVAAGRSWWTAAWTDPLADSAWAGLVASVGADRAEWVAHVCTPTNLASRGSAPTPSFPSVQPRGPRNIVARALPDRFVVTVVQNGQVSSAAGRSIPRDLALSPVPLDGDSPTRVAETLTLPPGSEWLIDYAKALEVGMAVTVHLPAGRAAVQRVIALGTRASLTAVAAADEFEDLLVGHRFSSGLGLLAQGTPTNNSDAARSPLRSRRAPVAPPRVPVVAQAGSDTVAAAAVLGVDSATLTALVGPGAGEQSIARTVNTALWAPGWGEYLGRLDKQGVPGVVDAQRESARRLFGEHVRGRGVAPTIHVGAQPYGVVPVSDLRRWVPAAGETTAGIAVVVRKLLDRWLAVVGTKVPTVRPGAPDVDSALLEVLGHSPVMVGLRVRPVISDDVSEVVLNSMGLDHREYEAEKFSVAAIFSTLLAEDSMRAVRGSLHQDTRPLPLPLASPRDPEFITALLENPQRVLSVDSVLQALLVLAWRSADLDVAKSAPATVLPTLVEFVELDPAIKVLASGLLARADSATADELHGVVGQMRTAGTMVGGASMLREFQPVESIQTSLAEVALAAPATSSARSLAAAALAGWFAAMGYRAEVREAIQGLVGTDLEARRLAVAEALDCSSHRLDAWATGVVAQRRAQHSARRGAPGSREARGLTIGAYGVVEDLTPTTGPGMDGWILAPSARHAITAGMLRSSHLSHLPDSGPASAGGPFAIDLSSTRIQAANRVLDGVRAGQYLGALIGYQIERSLAQAGLARLQLSLRTIAPLVARRLSDADGLDDSSAQEAVAATNVVDGVLLLQRHPVGDSTAMKALRDALDAEPTNAYLEPGDWKPLTDGQFTNVRAVLAAAAETLDAVADILLSESVMQFAGGNAQRAAAAMDAMSSGASPADTLDVLEAQDSGERLTHRLLAVVGTGTPATGWSTLRPRAQAEPRLEAWAGAHLGDPATIVVAEAGRRITLDEAGLAALDLVHATDLDALERTLRLTIRDLGDAPLAVTRDPGWAGPLRSLGQVMRLAGALRATIAGANPLMPNALVPSGVHPERDLGACLPELIGRASDLVGALGLAVVGLAPTIAAMPAEGILADQSAVDDLVVAAQGLEPFGITLTPRADLPLDVAWVRGAWEGARARHLAAQAGLDRIAALPGSTMPAQVMEAVQDVVSTILGDAFVVVPLLARPSAGSDAFVTALTNPAFPAPATSAVRRFIRDVGTVREQVRRTSEVLLLAGAIGARRDPEVVQLSGADANGPDPGTTHWLAGPLPPEGPWPATPVTHLVLERVGDITPTSPLAGLVLDAWVEDLPAQVGPKADPGDPRPGRVRMGLALRANGSSARPPQAILSAVSPDGKRWTTDSLRQVIECTLDLAKVRMLHLHTLPGEGLTLPALYTRSSSLQGQPYLDFRELATLSAVSVAMPFVKEMP